MTAPTGRLFSLSGTLKVAAKGFWFSAGGEKGSFGYYPHLKDSRGMPIYPDTQIHGDLKMAARWLQKLQGITFPIDEIFGRGGAKDDSPLSSEIPLSSKLFPGDLELDSVSAGKWQNNRFKVKSKIKVESLKRTIKDKFLVNLELAWLHGLHLEARMFLGPFGTEKELKAARSLLDEAVALLSGFGAFRSRGKSRYRQIRFDWDNPAEFAAHSTAPPVTPRIYALTAETHFRNSPVNPGNAQVVATGTAITPEQLKGWLALTYNRLYDAWPTPAEMAEIRLGTLYPSPAADVQAWPAPMTSLCQDDTFLDCWEPVSDKKKKLPDEEGYFGGKSKPLGEKYTVTADKKVYEIPLRQRFHNSMEDTFATKKENGLFAQEYLPATTIFSGSISFKKPESDFALKAWQILTNYRPIIKGGVFSPAHHTITATEPATGPYLVIEPLPFNDEFIKPENRITIATQIRYNTTLRRPERPRIVVAPGSILAEPLEYGTTGWHGFRQPLTLSPKPGDARSGEPPKPLPKPIECTVQGKAVEKLLRDLIIKEKSVDQLEQILADRIAKCDKKEQDSLRALLEEAREVLKTNGMDVFRARIKATVDMLKVRLWQPKPRKDVQEVQSVTDGGEA